MADSAAIEASRGESSTLYLMNTARIYLSSPHMEQDELTLVQEAFASNWIAALGPHIDSFEG